MTPTTMKRSGPARQGNLSAEERRAVTVEAVIELAGEQIPSDITTAAIASHMKLTQGALFRHFASKAQIWEAVMDWVADRLLSRLDRASADNHSAMARLEAIFKAHLEFVAEHPGVPRLMFGELQRPEDTAGKQVARRLIQRYASRLTTIIEQGRSSGELHAQVDPKAAATLFIGTIQGLVMQSMLSGNLRRLSQDAPGVFEIYRRGIIRPTTRRNIQ